LEQLVLDQVRLLAQTEPGEYGGRGDVAGIDASNDPVHTRPFEPELEHGSRAFCGQAPALEGGVQDVAELSPTMLDAAQEENELSDESAGDLVESCQGDPVTVRLEAHVHVPLECCPRRIGVTGLPRQVTGNLFPAMQVGELDVVAEPVGTQRHPLGLTGQVGEVHLAILA